MKKWLPLVLLAVCIQCTPFEPTPVVAQDADSIKIGALLHLTGEFAIQGVAFKNGIELAANEINSTGGINGRRIEVLFEDSQYKPLPSNIAAKKLAQINNVSAVLISTVTEAKAAGTVLQKEGVPTLVLWDSSPEVESLGSYIFGIGPWAPSSGERTAQFAKAKLHAKKGVIISSNTEWSQYVSRYFAATFSAEGGSIVGNYALNPDEADFRTTISKARSLDPEVIYAPIDGNIIPFFQQLRQMQVRIPIVTSDIVTEEYLTTEAESFEGVYQTMTGDPTFPASQKMYEAYRKHFGKPITQAQFVAWGYDGVMLIANAAKEAGGDRNKLRDALQHTKNVEGASGILTMTENRSAPRTVHVFRVLDGKFKMVEE